MATVLSMVLGLGVTRLLLGAVTVFRSRRHSPVDWLPLTWAFCLFLIQLQYWWAINQLPSIRSSYNFVDFVGFVVLTLMLFLAAAVVLPSRPEDEQGGLRHYFETEGRYGLVAISAFSAIAFIVNLSYFRAPLGSLASVWDIPIIILPTWACFARPRGIQVGIAISYVPLLLIDLVLALNS